MNAKRTHLAALALAAGLLAACGSDDDPASGSPYQLTFQGDGSFGPHAGQALRAALVRASDSVVLDRKAATVGTAGADPSFSVTFGPMLDPSAAYRVHYWIDSNFGGGTIDACDPPANDHQWSVDVPMGQATYKDTHRPGATSSVCASFPTYTLTFQGDASFGGPHGGQAVAAALVRGVDGTVAERLTGTVAAATPSFSFAFTTPLDPLSSYSVHYWIDSNFGGGTAGACDPPANDHQWSVALPAGQATVVDSHRPGATSSVCSSFP